MMFDLDGTLINSLADLAAAGNHILEMHGYPTHPTDAFRLFVGDGMLNLTRRMLPKELVLEEDAVIRLKEELQAYYYDHSLERTAPYPGIEALLRFCKMHGLRLGVFTNKPDAAAHRVVAALFGADVFDAVIGHREGRPHKPDPTAVLEELKAFGIRPADCLYVGDSGVDMQTARNAGCIPVGVLWGFRGYEELVQNGAKFLMESPEKLKNLVASAIDEACPLRIK